MISRVRKLITSVLRMYVYDKPDYFSRTSLHDIMAEKGNDSCVQGV